MGIGEILVVGMGRIGRGAYHVARERSGDVVLGIDSNPIRVQEHEAAGRRVLLGDPTDPDFRQRIERSPPGRLRLLELRYTL